MKTLVVLFAMAFMPLAVVSQKHVGSKAMGTDATMYENKEFVKRQFKKLVVRTGTSDVDYDKKIISEYGDLQTPIVSWLDVFPPIKDYSDEEVKTICSKNGIDGIISVTLKQADNIGLYNTKQNRYELALTDLETNLKAVTFLGKSSLGAFSSAVAPQKTILKFVRMTHDELKRVVIP